MTATEPEWEAVEPDGGACWFAPPFDGKCLGCVVLPAGAVVTDVYRNRATGEVRVRFCHPALPVVAPGEPTPVVARVELSAESDTDRARG